MQHLDDVFNARERQKEQDDHERKLAERRKRKLAPKTVSAKRKEIKDTAEEDLEASEGQTPDVQMEEEEEVAEEELQLEAPPEPANLPLAEENEAPSTEDGHDAETALDRAQIPDEIPGETAAARARRLRPKAEDMFASDEE
jgi:U2-associated protein SR140